MACECDANPAGVLAPLLSKRAAVETISSHLPSHHMPLLAAVLLHGDPAHLVFWLGSGLSVSTLYVEGQQGLPGAMPQSLGTDMHLQHDNHIHKAGKRLLQRCSVIQLHAMSRSDRLHVV